MELHSSKKRTQCLSLQKSPDKKLSWITDRILCFHLSSPSLMPSNNSNSNSSNSINTRSRRSFDYDTLCASLFTPINCVIPDQLFIGNQSAAEDIDLLRQHKITHIVQCTSTCHNPFPNSEFVYLTLEMADFPSFCLTESLERAYHFIQSALVGGSSSSCNNSSSGSVTTTNCNNNNDGSSTMVVGSSVRPQNRVLVHCSAGASRSAAIVLSYLMRTRHMTFGDALDHLQQIRPIVDPNIGFRRQLKEFEIKLRRGNEIANKS